MSNHIKKPEIIVFAGPNGSGKTTVARLAKIIEPYINADEIKRVNYCTDLEAAAFIPELVKVCDVLHIYDNSTSPFRIFKKRKTEYFYWLNEDWSKEKIQQLTGIDL